MAVGACEAVHRKAMVAVCLIVAYCRAGPGRVLSRPGAHLRYDLLMDFGFILLKKIQQFLFKCVQPTEV